MFIGTVPSSLCDIGALVDLYITYSDTNPLITCAPLCLTTVTYRYLPTTLLGECPSSQDDAICSIIAATNIESISGYEEWSCSSDGLTSTDPCSSPVWSGVTCSGTLIVSLALDTIDLTGMVIFYG